MYLKSTSMQLTSKERSWLPWFGQNGKLALKRSCYVNKSIYPVIEQTFEGIAATRVQLLKLWTNNHWDHLSAIRSVFLHINSAESQKYLQDKCQDIPDFSEIFVIDKTGKVLSSSYSSRIGHHHQQQGAMQKANQLERFLHGPYVDEVTLEIGPSSSKFHDEVTLMFYLPCDDGKKPKRFICGRVPNDVIGDIIQREAGHIYSESGDNYLFIYGGFKI